MRAAARVLLDILVALSVSAAAQPANGPLGIALEGWSYPFRVHFREFALEGQTLRQAYMDLPPATAPNGHTALLLHGRNFPASCWEGVIRTLAQGGWRVIATDQIGFGKSRKPDLAYDVRFPELGWRDTHHNLARYIDGLMTFRDAQGDGAFSGRGFSFSRAAPLHEGCWCSFLPNCVTAL
jgi:pimeloyl-ACP methyl ester carboxylesterase